MLRQHFSVFMLMVRANIYKVMLICFLMLTAEWTMLSFAMKQLAAPETLITDGWIMWFFYAAFASVTVVLCRFGCVFSSKCGYTFQRLSISEKSIYIWQAVCNFCFYALLWAVQLLIIYVFLTGYTQQQPEFFNHQTLFLAFHRNDFLHAMFPFDEWGVHLRNVFLLIGMSMTSAWYPYKQRRGKGSATVIVLAVYSLFSFPYSLGSWENTIFMVLISGVCIACVLTGLFTPETENTDNK